MNAEVRICSFRIAQDYEKARVTRDYQSRIYEREIVGRARNNQTVIVEIGRPHKTSALYILIIPCMWFSNSSPELTKTGQTLLILPHPVRTPEISNKIGLCSQKGPVLTSLMNPTAEKYILCFLSLSTIAFLAISAGLGEPGRDPSTGIPSSSPIAGQYCAEPKMYACRRI